MLLLCAAACGSGASTPTATAPSPTPHPALRDPAQVLAVSATALEDDAQPIDAEFNWQIVRDDFAIHGWGLLLLKSTGDLYLDSVYEGVGSVPYKFNDGDSFSLISTGGMIYWQNPALANRWYVYTPKQFGDELGVTQRLTAARSPLDIAALAAGSSGITDLGPETTDGATYEHYSASVDAGALMNALADAYGSLGQVTLANRFGGPIDIEVWVDPASLLLQRLEAKGDFTYLSGEARLDLTLNFVGPDDARDFPATPADVIPFQ